MIEKVIASILDAEKSASEILAEGTSTYRKIISDAESKADKDKSALLETLKGEQTVAYAKAEETATSNYVSSLEEGKAEAQTLKAESSKKIDEAVSFIVGKVI